MVAKPKSQSLKFPDGFIWGAATSSHQVEGGNHNNWSEWEKVGGHIKDGAKSGLAADHWSRYKEDFEYLSDMYLNGYRFSIEWSRIEPKEGEWNETALDRYADMVRELKRRRVTPVVTLHHFTNPVWIDEHGSWASGQTVDYFLRFVAKVVERLGPDVQMWCTLNEPNIETGLDFMLGWFPPGRKNPLAFLRARYNFVQAHKRAYALIHFLYKERGWGGVQVSFANHLVYVEPRDSHNPLDQIVAWAYRFVSNQYFLGRTQSTTDFLGINYYFYHRLYFKLGGAMVLFDEEPLRDAPVSDLGWQIAPEGLYQICKSLKRFDKPIYITENGLSDAKDTVRPWSLVRHAEVLHRVISEGVDVRGYFYWSLIDTFEWENGYKARYGLVAVDFESQKRRPRPSVKVYADIAEHNAVSRELLERYS
ncbi:MAG TPA: glycoside hydrolase family 1 protein [Candidatus Saccharimonadia bacterium]|jgi:beta-glucosidase